MSGVQNLTPREPGEEVVRLNALIERYANWLIQDRNADADYLRGYIKQMEKQRDALLVEGGFYE